MNKLKNLVKMSADEYNEMVQNGSVDIGGTLVSFDVGNLCLVPEEPIVIDTTLANAGQAADAAAVGAALESKYDKADGVKIFGNNSGSNSGSKLTVNPTAVVLSTDDQKLATWYENGSIELYVDGIGFVDLSFPTESGTIATQEYVRENAGGGKLYWNEVCLFDSNNEDNVMGLTFLSTKPITTKAEFLDLIDVEKLQPAYMGFPCSGTWQSVGRDSQFFTAIMYVKDDDVTDRIIFFGGTIHGEEVNVKNYYLTYSNREIQK